MPRESRFDTLPEKPDAKPINPLDATLDAYSDLLKQREDRPDDLALAEAITAKREELLEASAFSRQIDREFSEAEARAEEGAAVAAENRLKSSAEHPDMNLEDIQALLTHEARVLRENDPQYLGESISSLYRLIERTYNNAINLLGKMPLPEHLSDDEVDPKDEIEMRLEERISEMRDLLGGFGLPSDDEPEPEDLSDISVAKLQKAKNDLIEILNDLILLQETIEETIAKDQPQ